MRLILPTLLALTSALHAAEPATQSSKKPPAASLLPNGSELQGVMIPRHNEKHQLVSSIRAKLMTLVSSEVISGKTVILDFYNTDGSQRAQINLIQASLNQSKGMLNSYDPVTIESDKFRAKGSGLHYAFRQGEGFLTGPATTWIQSPPTATTMNTRPSLISAASIALLSQVTAAPAENDKKPVMINTVHGERKHAQIANDARSSLREDLEASEATLAKTKAFLEQAELADQQGTSSPDVEAKPLEITPGPRDTVITCDGGMYFDADNGVLVYLKNVRVNDPRFTLDGAKELKIYLSKKPEKPLPPKEANKPADPKATDKPSDPKATEKPSNLDLDAKFGDVERIIATGAVHILQKEVEKGKLPVEASGAIFTYHPSTGDIVLSGGYPWVKQGNSFMRAKEPNLNLRIKKSGSFVTEGNWDMGGNLNKK